MTGLDELRITFFQECEDLLDRLGTGLRDLAADPGTAGIDTIHAVFRAVHSIKGGAGAFGLEDLVGFAHLFETVLDNLRAGRMEMTAPVAGILLRAGDVLDDLVQAAQDGTAASSDSLARVVAELELHADGGEDDSLDDFVFEPLVLELDDPVAPPPSAGPGAGPAAWDIHLAPRAGMYRNGNEPAALIAALAWLGPVQVTPDTSRIVSLEDFNPDQPGLQWSIRLESDADESAIRALFDFVEDVADISITRTGPAPAGPGTGGTAPTPAEPPDLPAPPGAHADPPAPGRSADLSPVSVSPVAASPVSVSPAAPSVPAPPRTDPARANAASVAAPATVRVDLDRVDRLANLIGELVIMEAVLSRIITDTGLGTNADAASGLDRIRQLAAEIQESVMAIRAQPLRPIFQRMERVLREATQATGKRARLVATGADTEVDKTVIERLVDPLTHMIRNAVDHGLEDTAARKAMGKPEEGTIALSAAHRSGRVLIEIADDGGGIDRAHVRRIAEARGLVAPDTPLAGPETDAILFMPGFSSKAVVSAVSGRGVGLDVVQREIQALGGRVTIASAPGAGSTFTISLPLTLAVLEGMLIEFGGQTMVLPLASVAETLNPAGATIHMLGTTGQMVASEGRLVPVIDLAAYFRLAPANSDAGVLIVIEADDGSRAAVTAERILDQRQVVIKSLEDHCGPVPGISAATILGDGRIALILDPEALLRRSRSAGAATAMAGMAGGFS